MGVRGAARDVGINILAQLIWAVLVLGASLALILVFGSADGRRVLSSQTSVPTWLLVVVAFVALMGGPLLFWVTRKGSAVRGRADATRANVDLFRERTKVPLMDRMILSTRFGRWPRAEVLEHRSAFRRELDEAILTEETEVRRIWNITSIDDIDRIHEVLERYRGKTNHSIRAYFNIPDHALPEILVVSHRGASMSFPSSRTARDLDWMIRFRRRDLMQVVREYFDVLWDRAERILDAGEVTTDGQRRLDQMRHEYSATGYSATGPAGAEVEVDQASES